MSGEGFEVRPPVTGEDAHIYTARMLWLIWLKLEEMQEENKRHFDDLERVIYATQSRCIYRE